MQLSDKCREMFTMSRNYGLTHGEIGCHDDGIPAANGFSAADGITAPSGIIPAKAGIQ